MATFQITDIAISGIACCVPEKIESNWDLDIMSKEDIGKFVDATGIENRRIVNKDTCTSDLCVTATEKLLAELQWDKSEIEILVFVTQSPDYIIPVSSAIIQDRLGLSKKCIAFDVPLGCSGYVYGLAIVGSMMRTAGIKKGLLLAGDTPSKTVAPRDKSTRPLFGDAGSATAIELKPGCPPMLFDLGTDGSGHEAIIVRAGAAREKITAESLVVEVIEEGIERSRCQLELDGMDVFSFGISQAPKTVNNLLTTFNIDKDNVDYFVFHQANLMMNKMIAKKLKLPNEKVPYSLKDYGNTSSATVPLTIVTELNEETNKNNTRFVFCGFGIGLSWGTMYVETDKIVCLPVIEV